MAVTLISRLWFISAVITSSTVKSTPVDALPTHSSCPVLYENCPRGTVPSHSVFDPAVGEFQLSCKESAMPDGECVLLDDDKRSQSFRCPPNHALVGRDKQRPVCCKLKGVCLTGCFIPKVLYSFKIGFEFDIQEGYALVGKYSYGMCEEDPSVFQIEICKLTQH